MYDRGADGMVQERTNDSKTRVTFGLAVTREIRQTTIPSQSRGMVTCKKKSSALRVEAS